MKKPVHLLILLTLQFSNSIAQTPGFEWVHTLGGTSEDYSRAITTDQLNNVYFCGSYMDSVDLDPGPGVTVLSTTGVNGFIQKLNPNGELVWVKSVPPGVVSMEADASGNVVLSGTFSGTVTFSTLSGNYTFSSPSTTDLFILKVNPDGDFLWAKSFGIPNKSDYINDLQLDASGNIYSIGCFSGFGDFDPGAGTANLSSTASSLDIFIQKLSADGDYIWAKKIGSGGNDFGTALAIRGNAVLATGWFQGSVDFDPSAASATGNSAGEEDMYLLSLSTDGNFNWVKTFGSALGDQGTDLAFTSNGEIYILGKYEAPIDVDPGTGSTVFQVDDNTDFFILKLSGTGDFIWARKFTGTGYKISSSLTVLPNNGVVFTGAFNGVVDFDCGPGVNNLVSNGLADIFTVYLNQDGTYLWAGSYGNTGTVLSDSPVGIQADNQGNIYTIGNFYGTVDFDCGSGIAERTASGPYDMFMQKINSNVLAVNENALKDFKLYPNPSSQDLFISAGNLNHTQLIICNALGKIVLEKELSGTEAQLDIQSLSPGSYVVHLTNDSGSQHQTFIKTN